MLYTYIYLSTITFAHNRVLDYHIYVGGKVKIIT